MWYGWLRFCAAVELRVITWSAGIPWTDLSHQHMTNPLFPHKYDENRYSLKNISQICDYPKIFWASNCPGDDFHCPVYSHHWNVYIYVDELYTVSTQDGLRCGSAAARLLWLRVRLPPGACMSVCCDQCVLSGRGLCDGGNGCVLFLQCVAI
jgi:hypothetical protein